MQFFLMYLTLKCINCLEYICPSVLSLNARIHSVHADRKSVVYTVYCVSDSIVSMIYIRENILGVRTYLFINGMSRKKDTEHIWERKADFESFKNVAQVIERTCNTIQSSISLWKEYLEDIFENN